jgi:hypothetical protein
MRSSVVLTRKQFIRPPVANFALVRAYRHVACIGARHAKAFAPDGARFIELTSEPERSVAELRALQPDAVVVFSPELVPAGLLHRLDAAVLGLVTPSALAAVDPIDPSNFDRIAAVDRKIADALPDGFPLWRTIPFPVADSRFRDVEPLTAEPRFALDPTAAERESFLASTGADLDGVPVVSSADGDDFDVLIHFANGRRNDASDVERLSLQLAAGRLVIADRNRPRADLQPGIHYLEAQSGWDLAQIVYGLRRWPDTYDVVRMRARQRAERSRASLLYPRILGDLYRDLAAFGSERPNT